MQEVWMELLRVVLALGGVCLLAWLSLRQLARRGVGMGMGARSGGRVRVLQRLPLDGGRALYLVRADARTLLMAAGQTGAPVLVTELGEPSREAPGEERLG